MAPKEIIEAIKAVREGVKTLKHDAENPHGGYDYVSIDKYYEQVAPLVTKAGLIWRTREMAFDFLENQGKNKDRTYAKAKFGYDLYCGAHEFPDYMSVTIISPIDGPQTTGQLYSYADKVFMRVAFCVPTGEKDADATKPEAIIRQPDPILDPPKGLNGKDAGTVGDLLRDLPSLHDPITGEIREPIPPEQWRMSDTEKSLAPKFKDDLPLVDTRKIDEKAATTIFLIFKTFMPLVKTKAKLSDWHAENLAAIEKVRTIDPEVHDKIKRLFNDRNLELKQKEAK